MQGVRPSDIWWKPDSQLLEHWFSILDARGNYLMKLLSRVRLFATPWTVAHQAPLSMGFSRQEYWSGLLCSPPGDLPDPGMKPASPALAGGLLTTEPLGRPKKDCCCLRIPKFYNLSWESTDLIYKRMVPRI